MMSDSQPTLSAEADDRSQAISDLHARQYRKATSIQRFLDGVVAKLSNPAPLFGLTVAILGWIAINLALAWAGAEMGNSQNGNNNAYCQDNTVLRE